MTEQNEHTILKEIDELIKRIEAADEPTSELFSEGYMAFWGRPQTSDAGLALIKFRQLVLLGAWNDAAMQMMPHGWAIERSYWWPPAPDDASNAHNGKSSVSLVKQSYGYWYQGERLWAHSSTDPRVEAKASHPALALLAASLKAATVS